MAICVKKIHYLEYTQYEFKITQKPLFLVISPKYKFFLNTHTIRTYSLHTKKST